MIRAIACHLAIVKFHVRSAAVVNAPLDALDDLAVSEHQSIDTTRRRGNYSIWLLEKSSFTD